MVPLLRIDPTGLVNHYGQECTFTKPSATFIIFTSVWIIVQCDMLSVGYCFCEKWVKEDFRNVILLV